MVLIFPACNFKFIKTYMWCRGLQREVHCSGELLQSEVEVLVVVVAAAAAAVERRSKFEG